MPVRTRKNLRRRRSAQTTSEAVALFRQGIDLQRGPHDPNALRDIKIRLAAALSRSKFCANPLDPQPRSLIGCDTEPPAEALALQAQLLRAIGQGGLDDRPDKQKDDLLD